MKIKAYPHRSINNSKGVVRSPELATCTIEEIKLNLKKQFVTDIKRISINKKNQIVNTNIHTFNSPNLPPKLKIGYIIAKVCVCVSSSSSSSSCRAGSRDIHDPLSPLFPIVHRLWQVFWTTSRILT